VRRGHVGLLAQWQERLRHYPDELAGAQIEEAKHKPERPAERIEEALTEPEPHRALLLMTELQAETVALAPDGPNIIRARKWLSDGREILAQPPA
jgi:hypothetical protein